jgi:hypothetical protein
MHNAKNKICVMQGLISYKQNANRTKNTKHKSFKLHQKLTEKKKNYISLMG